MKGDKGPVGLTGVKGAVGPAGRPGTLQDMSRQIEYIDRSIENIYNEMGSHIQRMGQLQGELNVLRDTVRQLAVRTLK